MLATEDNLNVLALVGVVTSGLVGTGAVAFFVRYGTRLTLLERTVETSQLITLHPRLSRVEDAIGDMKQLLPKLNVLDVILNKMEAISATVTALVPRSEHEVRWQREEERFASIQRDIDRMQGFDKIHSDS